jgi:hypothetical protein
MGPSDIGDEDEDVMYKSPSRPRNDKVCIVTCGMSCSF